MIDQKVAIVGSEEKRWSYTQAIKAALEIYEILDDYSTSWLYKKITLVSGGCPRGGVDIWAEVVANKLGIEKKIYLPEVEQWEDEVFHDDSQINPPEIRIGYKSRNIQIAEACDALYCIEPKDREWSGARWTLNYAKRLGKPTYLVEIE